jgi:hypothetical protein
MRRRAIILTCIFTSIFALAMMISAHRSSHTAAAPLQAKPVSVVPAGTIIQIRLVQSISEDNKAGDILQGVVADPVQVNSQIVIPVHTRALIRVVGIQGQKGDVANVSFELNELISRNRKVPVPSSTVTKVLKRMSDVDVIARGFFGMLDVAIGAAGTASAGKSPNAAATFGPLSAGAAQQDTPEVLVFTTAEPLELTTVTW